MPPYSWLEITARVQDQNMAADDNPHVVSNLTAAVLALSWIAVLLRIYVRAKLIQAFGLDDWLAVATLVGLP